MKKKYFITASLSSCLGGTGMIWTQAFAGSNFEYAKNMLKRYKKDSIKNEDTKNIIFWITELWENEDYHALLSKTKKPSFAKKLDYI